MRIEANKLEFFQDLYRRARSYADDEYEKLQQHIEQYKGSKKIDGATEDAKTVRNITYELVESQISSYLPMPSVNPIMWSEANQRKARTIENLLKNKRDELPFEKMNDIDERYNPIYGGSVWLIEWDNSITTHNTVGDIKISCWSPQKFTGQPGIYEINDMEYCFIHFETTKEDIERKYGVSASAAEEAESDGDTDTNDETATVYVCYYKNDDGKICQYIWSGDTELSDIDDYYNRKKYVCKKCGKRKEICSCDKPDYEKTDDEYEEPDHDIRLSDGRMIPVMSEVIENGQVVTEETRVPARLENGQVALEEVGGVLMQQYMTVQVPKLEKTKLPFYTPSFFPIVIRKNTSQEESLFGQSDCEFIRPQQQAINKLESRILEKLIGGGVYPVVPPDFNAELDNSVFKKVFRAEQNNYNIFRALDLQANIQQDIAQSERLYDQAKRILGITDSFQGQKDTTAQSGIAKQIQVSQSAGRLDSKKKMKNAAYAEIDRIIFQYYLAYADEPRPVAYKDAQGRIQNESFNRYDFLERDEAGEYYYDDRYMFSADSSADTEKNKEFLWQENRVNFQQGAYGAPNNPETLLIFWQNMERARYPFAHENVERIREIISAMVQAQQQQIQGLQNEIQGHNEYEKYLNEFINAGGMTNGNH